MLENRPREVRRLTPIGAHVLTNAVLAFLSIFPEYLTTLWIVKAGKPMLARLWKVMRFAMMSR